MPTIQHSIIDPASGQSLYSIKKQLLILHNILKEFNCRIDTYTKDEAGNITSMTFSYPEILSKSIWSQSDIDKGFLHLKDTEYVNSLPRFTKVIRL